MTFYEQIQASIDYAEKNLQSNTVSFEVAARHAMMSVSNFYRYFNAHTGYSFKEYLRKRRLTNSLVELISDKSIIEIAYNNCFESHEVYTRAFKKEFKLTPSEYRKKQPHIHGLQPIKIVKETFMGVVIKNLPEMKVAYYRVISKDPEIDALTHIKRWGDKHKVFKTPYRIFGFNNPGPKETKTVKDLKGNEAFVHANNDEYGYEFMISTEAKIVPEKNGRGVDIKTIPGGKFAVLSIGVGSEENDIGKGWKKMVEFMKKSNYKSTGRWFEEHIDFNPDIESQNFKMDLYVEIK